MEPFDPSAAPSEESAPESRPPRRERSERRPRQDKGERAPRDDGRTRAPRKEHRDRAARSGRPPRFGDEVSTEAQPDARSGGERRPRAENEAGRGRDRGRDRGNDRRPRRDDHDDGPAVVGFGDHMPSFLMKPARVAQPETGDAAKVEE